MKLTTRQLTRCALLAALALALSYAENWLPLQLVIPLPGVKLGLANIVTVYALCILGPGQTLLIVLCRCLLGAMFAGNASALLFSLLGGLLALGVEYLLLRFCRGLSIFGVSMGGAATHNCGQMCAAVLTLGSVTPLVYLPALLVTGLFTGLLTGAVVALLLRRVPHY